MTTQLTARDKKLLILLAFVIVIFIFVWYVVLPLNKSIQALKLEVAAADNEKFQIQQELINLASINDTMETLNIRIDGYSDNFYPNMTSDEIDRLLTTTILGHGLEARSLNITMPTAELVTAPYPGSERYNALMAEEDADDELIRNGEARTGICAALANVTLGGTRQSLQEIIDDWSDNYPSISVDSYTWSASRDAVDGYYLTMTLNVYMLTEE